MRKGSLFILLLAIVMGGVAAYMARVWIIAQMPVKEATHGTVVVAAAPLAFGTALSRENVTEIDWPAGAVPEGAYATKDQLFKDGRRAALAPLQRLISEGVAPDGHHDPEALTRTLRRVAQLSRHPGLVVVVSDFRMPRNWRRAMAALRARHSVLAVEVRDPRETELPAVGHLALVDPETGERLEVDTHSPRLRERFAQAEAEERTAVAGDLRHALSEHIVLTTDGDWLRSLGGRLR